MIAVTLALLLAPAPPLADIGPEPTMEEFIALAEPALASKLSKPRSATFEWPYKLVAGPAGYYTCGLVGPRKFQHGRWVEVWVSAVVAHGKVLNAQTSTSNGMLAWLCKGEVRKGRIVAR